MSDDLAGIDCSRVPEGTVLLGRSGVVYVRRPQPDVERDGLGEWRGTHGGILMNWQVQRDAAHRLVPEEAEAMQMYLDQTRGTPYA